MAKITFFVLIFCIVQVSLGANVFREKREDAATATETSTGLDQILDTFKKAAGGVQEYFEKNFTEEKRSVSTFYFIMSVLFDQFLFLTLQEYAKQATDIANQAKTALEQLGDQLKQAITPAEDKKEQS